MPSGKLCYLDFGMVSYVEPAQRYSIIQAVVHLINRDFVELATLYRKMGFIPADVDPAPIIVALEVCPFSTGFLSFINDKITDTLSANNRMRYLTY